MCMAAKTPKSTVGLGRVVKGKIGGNGDVFIFYCNMMGNTWKV